MSDRTPLIRTWLAAILDDPGVRIEPVSDDASFRRYFRARAGGRSLIVMDAPPDKEDCAPYLHVAGLLRDAGLNVPEVLAAEPEQGLLLLTDLGDERYLDVLDERNAARLYGDALDALLRMQARAATGGLPEYDDGRLRAELSLFADWFLVRYLGIEPGHSARAALDSTFDLLCASAREQPRAFVHRDYHSRNLMHCPARNPGILDFQDAVRGPVTYDLVSLLRDVYLRWPPERVAQWLEEYLEQAVEDGLLAAAERGSFRRWFDLMGIQRHLKVAGIFARLFLRDGKPGYLKDIPLTLDYLCEVAGQYPELGRLSGLLDDLGIRERLLARNAGVTGARVPV